MLSAQDKDRRIIPLSEWKAHTGTHYRRKEAIPLLKDEDICVDNAMRYIYYDKSRRVWSTALSPCEELTQSCKDIMPQRSKTLDRYLSKPPSASDGLPSNEPIVCESLQALLR
jgi:hypothetical protein